MDQPRQQQLAFRPPVHRKHERSNHGKRSPKPAHRRSVRTYADVALHVMGGSDADMMSLRSALNHPPSHSHGREKHGASGNASAESSLSRDTVSQASSLRSKSGHQGSSFSKNRTSRDFPFGLEGEVHESSLYVPPAVTPNSKSRKKGKPKVLEDIAPPLVPSPLEESMQPQPLIPEIETQSKQSETVIISKITAAEETAKENEDVDICISRERGVSNHNCVTLTGTIKRGGRQDLVNVLLTPEEMAVLNRATSRERKRSEKRRKCGCASGPHVILLSLMYLPLAFISSLFLSFYTGSLCWYNVYIYLSEECSIAHKIFLCPLLIISYPLYIVTTSFLIAFYAMFVQMSWHFASWQREIKNLDKNFYGWLCNKIGVPQCAPYEVIILDDNAQGIESIECLGEGSQE